MVASVPGTPLGNFLVTVSAQGHVSNISLSDPSISTYRTLLFTYVNQKPTLLYTDTNTLYSLDPASGSVQKLGTMWSENDVINGGYAAYDPQTGIHYTYAYNMNQYL